MASTAELSRAAWRTSSYSNNGGNCVELVSASGIVGIRDTKNRSGAMLRVSAEAWEHFTASMKSMN